MGRDKVFYTSGNKVTAKYKKKPERLLFEILNNCCSDTIDIAYSIEDGLDKSSNPRCTSHAQCDERDTFDEKLGKEIAAVKVDLKFHRHREKQLRQLIKKINKASAELTKLADIHDLKARRIEEDYEKYYR